MLDSMPNDYFHEAARRVVKETERLRRLPAPNSAYAMGYKNHLELLNRNPKTVDRRLRELRLILTLMGQKDAKRASRADIERIVLKINRSGYATITRGKIKLCLKTFYRWLLGGEGKEYPSLVGWISIDMDKHRKLPEDMLTEDDVRRLLEACLNPRDRGMIALLWDTGARIGEILGMRVKDLGLNSDVSFVRLSGKTGDRKIPIVFSTAYLGNYLDQMRPHAKPDDWLFVKMDHKRMTDRMLDYPDVLRLLDDLKMRSGLQKRLYPHLFRHSRASFYANRMTEQQLKAFFGWTGGSDMAATYVHLSGRDINDAVLAANGLTQTGKLEPPKLTIKECWKCHARNEATAAHCTNCGTALARSPVEQFSGMEGMQRQITKLQRELLEIYQRLPADIKKQIANID